MIFSRLIKKSGAILFSIFCLASTHAQQTNALKVYTKRLIALTLFALLAACGGSSGSGSNDSDGDETITLSGTVQGFSDGDLTLSNSGEDSKEINGNNAFSFTVTEGEAYNIIVDENPEEQLCHVENGTSSSASGNTTDIIVICESVSEALSCDGNTDSDGDTLSDCQELNTYLTNPWEIDTDGDGFDDGREVQDFDPNNNYYVFNPRVADLAQIAIELTAIPEIDLDFTQSAGSSCYSDVSYEQSEINSISQDWGGETSRQLEIGHTFSASVQETVGTGFKLSPTDIGVSGSYELSLTRGFERSAVQTRGSSINWSQSATEENMRAFSETIGCSEDQNTTYEGGELRVTAQVVNAGHISYDLENLTLSAFLFDPTRPFEYRPIGTMEFATRGFPPISIATGASAPLNFSTELTLPLAQNLLRDSKNIVIVPGTYRALNSENTSLLLAETEVSARTATITIDYGIDAAREDTFRVSVNRGDSSRMISLADALTTVLGLDIYEGPGLWTYGNDASPSSTPSGLLQIGSYEMNNTSNRYWLMAHNHTDGANSGSRVTDYYNLLTEEYYLDQIELRAGDYVNLIYVGDQDRDAISDRMERELGTDRNDSDSDDDLLNDGLEVYGWLTNLAAPACADAESIRVYSNPLLADSDNDGTNDAIERENCENPSFDFRAIAGDEQIVNKGMEVSLSGSIGGIATDIPVYRWNLISGPNVIDENGDSVNALEGREPRFTAPDEVSTLLWELSITLGDETQTDRVLIQVQEDRTKAVYVGTLSANNIENGSKEAPYSNLSLALQNINLGEDLYVMTQEQPYTLINSLNIPAGTSIYGGYDENWVRDTENNRTPLNRDTDLSPATVRVESVSESEAMWISGFNIFANGDNDSTTASSNNDVIALDISITADSGDTGTLYIENNTLISSNVKSGSGGDPGSSYALRVVGLPQLQLHNNTLRAGSGGRGASGAAGQDGANGDYGQSNRTGGAGGKGGNGGRGGVGRTNIGTKGNNGSPYVESTIILVSGGTGGGGGGGGGGVCNRGESGQSGDPGPSGQHGNPILAEDENKANRYVASKGGDGTDGISGAGGGGGGGGGPCPGGKGGPGGGGGEGGENGTGGKGGAGGGASIALWLQDIMSAEIRGNIIEAGKGGAAGNGGTGGDGGSGGDGASGGTGTSGGAIGGSGGDGGSGGSGGEGQGGNGGPSFGIFVGPNIAPLLYENTISSGNAGNGGFSRGYGGDGGDSYAIFDANLTDGAIPEIDNEENLSFGFAGRRGPGIVRSPGSNGSRGKTNF